MLAKVKPTYNWQVVTAFAGREFVKYEWRRVPAGHEDEALRHPLLDIDEEVEVVEKKPKKAKTHDELKAEAKAAGIPNYWSMSAETLEARLDEIDRTD